MTLFNTAPYEKRLLHRNTKTMYTLFLTEQCLDNQVSDTDSGSGDERCGLR